MTFLFKTSSLIVLPKNGIQKYKVHFSAGFRKIGDMALRRLCMALRQLCMVLKTFEGKYKAVKATCMALKIGQGSGHKERYVHEKYDDQKRKDIKWRCIVAPKFCILLERLQTYKEE